MTPHSSSGGGKLVRSPGAGGLAWYQGVAVMMSLGVNQEFLSLPLRSPARHPAEDWGQRSHCLPGESGTGLSSTVQPHHREGAQQDLQHPHRSVCPHVCLSAYLSLCLPVCSPVCLSACPAVSISVSLLTRLSVSFCLPAQTLQVSQV